MKKTDRELTEGHMSDIDLEVRQKMPKHYVYKDMHLKDGNKDHLVVTAHHPKKPHQQWHMELKRSSPGGSFEYHKDYRTVSGKRVTIPEEFQVSESTHEESITMQDLISNVYTETDLDKTRKVTFDLLGSLALNKLEERRKEIAQNYYSDSIENNED